MQVGVERAGEISLENFHRCELKETCSMNWPYHLENQIHTSLNRNIIFFSNITMFIYLTH